MAENQELQVREKREVDTSREATKPTRAFVPSADIYESENTLTVVLEMPGVSKENVDVNVEDGVLTVEGRIEFSQYERLQPVYSEYNVGPYRRSFQISNQIDHSKIAAQMRDGIMTLELPKVETAKPRRIQVS
jgi:HSP20 family molecular chaperone IbpA